MNQVGEPLTPEDVEKLLSAEMTAGLEYVYGADNIAAERDRNYEYFLGVMNDLPAPAGRSRVIDPVVANYIGLLMPQLLRIFTSGRTIAEYASPKPELQNVVKLTTRFINDVVFKKDNRGELMLRDWCTDALVQKMGVAMYWWEECHETKDEILEGIPDQAFPVIVQQAQQAGAEIVEHSAQEVAVQTPEGAATAIVHAIKVRTKVNKSKCCIDVIPPEEFIISRSARNTDEAVLKAHRTGALVGDLLKQGYDAEKIEGLPDYAGYLLDADWKYARNTPIVKTAGSAVDPSLRKVAITRGILRMDYDGTGIKEWYVVAGGPEHSLTMLEIQPYNDQIGFADFCPEPLPHTVFGTCPADRLAGIQKIQTVLIRQANDNLFLSNTPQREVVMDWIVKPDQLMNMSPGAPVLVKQPGAIREISIPFVADKAMAMMDYYNAQAEITTGVGRNTAGLDPDSLQNQSATAAQIQQSAQQGRAEMYARVWAQGGMRKLFRGVFRCIKAYQDFARVVQIDGAPQTVDPRAWEGLDELDVNINTGLGTGNRERDFAMLSAIEADQEKIITQFGQDNPMVDLRKLIRTKQLKAEAAGISYPENFYGDPVMPDGQPWVFQPPPAQPSPDTIVNAQAFVAVEKGKAESREREKAAELQTEREKAVAEITSRERTAREKNYWDAMLKAEELGIKKADTLIHAAEVDAKTVADDARAARDSVKEAPEPDKGSEALASAIEGMTAVVEKMQKPKTIKRDEKGRAVGIE